MFCMSCGTALRDNAKFCHACGAPVGSPQAPSVAQQPASQPLGADHPIPDPPVLNRRTTIITVNGKRSQILFPCRSGVASAVAVAQDVLRSNGFAEHEYRGEAVWKKGTGMATAMQYAVVMPYGDGLLVQGWVQVGVGDAGLSEMHLEGVLAAIPKKSLLKVIEKIRQAI